MELSPAGLGQLYNLPVEAVPSAMRLEQQLAGANELNNRKAQLANMFAEENNPVLVEQNRLENQAKQARLPGILAESESSQLKTGRERATQGDAIEAAKKRFIKEASDHDLGMLENRAQQMAYSQDPATRAQGEQILRMHKDIVKQRELTNAQYDRAMGLERLRGENAVNLANVNIEGGKYKRSGKAILTADQAIDNAKTAKERHQKLIDAATVASQEGDEELAARYRARAEAIRPQAEAELVAVNPKPGTPDLPALGIGVNPSRPIAPPPALSRLQQDIQNGAQFSSPELEQRLRKAAGLDKPPSTLADVQKLYPGVPPEKLKEAYKKKFNVDLK